MEYYVVERERRRLVAHLGLQQKPLILFVMPLEYRVQRIGDIWRRNVDQEA